MRKRLSIPKLIFGCSLILFVISAMTLHRVDHALWKYGNRHQVDPLLLRAVGITESNLNPKAVGAAGEIGMFQIMPNTAKHWALENNLPIPSEKQLFQLRHNANISAWYLREGLNAFPEKADPIPYALAYYNAGPSRAFEWDKQVPEGFDFVEFIPFPGTRRYVTKILGIYRVED